MSMKSKILFSIGSGAVMAAGAMAILFLAEITVYRNK